MTIYDAHIHIPGGKGEVFHQVGTRIRSMDQLVKMLDRYGIDRGVICSTVSTLSKTPREFVRGNREVLEAVEEYPSRFWGACTVNPRFLEEAVEELEICRNTFGFPWLGELCPYLGEYQATSPEMFSVIERASELGYIIHIHSSNDEAERIIANYPDTTFVFAHLQGFADCERRFEILVRRENLYLDISGSEIVRHGILERALEILGPKKILFGSDLIIDNPIPTIARVNDLDISDRDKQRILWRNLDDLLRNAL